MGKHGPGFGATFWVPLTKEQFTCLGKIAALFGQIETHLDQMVLALSGLSSLEALESFYDGKQFGSKVNLLRRLAKDKTSGSKKTLIDAACTALDGVAGARNQAIHGQWGRVESAGDPNNGKAIAASARNPGKYLPASGLPALVVECERAARAVYVAMGEFRPPLSDSDLPIRHVFVADEQTPSRPKSWPRPPKQNGSSDRSE